MVVAEKAEIKKVAEPRFLEGTNNKAVLVIHGYTGYPGEYYEISELLNKEGYTVSLPLLPGHGRNRDSFKKTNWKDWLECIKKEYRKLEETYETVSLVGLSMGGVLSIILASQFNPERIALLAPAMAVHGSIFYMTPFLKFFLDEVSKNWVPEKGDSDEVVELGKEYWSRNYVKQLAGLRKLQKMAIKNLKNVSSPALVMLSEIDDSVPVRAGDIIRKGLKDCPSHQIVLKNSPHVILSGPEKDYINNQIIQWINKGEINE